MAQTVRVNKRLLKQIKLDGHYHSYRTVLPNDTTTFVPGEGDVMSPVVFIGEAPGEQEERLGRPFVGKSGNLLIKVMKTIGLNRRDVFITNLVKYRPPGNADPTPAQVMSAKVLMQWELRILKPRVVVTLGRFATEVFYPNPKISNLAGTCREKLIDRDWYTVVPMYHPSAALRHSRVRALMYEHIQKVQEALLGR